ncbi:hypothetical protein [Olivibacter sp. SDN3]|nr:hypothetical protein [Olivibacter sp. SDN3]
MMKRKRGKSRISKLFRQPITLLALEVFMLAAEKEEKCIPYEGL